MTTETPAPDAPSKSTLFCPDCGHRSAVDGDWIVVETARDTRYLCPECSSRIAARPRRGTDGSGRPNRAWEHARRAWENGVRAWRRLWTRAV